MKIFTAFSIAVLAVGCTKPVELPENNAGSPNTPRMDAANPDKPGMHHAESLQTLDADRQEADRLKKRLDDLEREVFETGSSLVTMRGEQEAAKNGDAAGRDEAVATWQKRIDEANKTIAKLKSEYEIAYAKWLDYDERVTRAEADSKALQGR